jgi:hypothetical protein
LKRLTSIADYERFMEKQYQRLKDKDAVIPLDEL